MRIPNEHIMAWNQKCFTMPFDLVDYVVTWATAVETVLGDYAIGYLLDMHPNVIVEPSQQRFFEVAKQVEVVLVLLRVTKHDDTVIISRDNRKMAYNAIKDVWQFPWLVDYGCEWDLGDFLLSQGLPYVPTQPSNTIWQVVTSDGTAPNDVYVTGNVHIRGTLSIEGDLDERR